MTNNWLAELEIEFERAYLARASGNEGQARVCARRAAGIAIREYFIREGIPFRGLNTPGLISRFSELPTTPDTLILVCDHLVMRVTDDFSLPKGVDLLQESHQLCEHLFPHCLKN